MFMMQQVTDIREKLDDFLTQLIEGEKSFKVNLILFDKTTEAYTKSVLMMRGYEILQSVGEPWIIYSNLIKRLRKEEKVCLEVGIKTDPRLIANIAKLSEEGIVESNPSGSEFTTAESLRKPILLVTSCDDYRLMPLEAMVSYCCNVEGK